MYAGITTKEIMEPERYLKSDFNDFKETKIIPPNLDLNDSCFGGIEVTYKIPKYNI